jgi:hypothetical protein
MVIHSYLATATYSLHILHRIRLLLTSSEFAFQTRNQYHSNRYMSSVVRRIRLADREN